MRRERSRSLEVDGRNLTVFFFENQGITELEQKSKVAENTDVAAFLSERGISLNGTETPTPNTVTLEFVDKGGFGPWLGLLLNILPFLLFGLFLLLNHAAGFGLKTRRR